MRILLVGPLAETSGYGDAAARVARSLLAAGADLATRTAIFTAGGKPPPDLAPLESVTMTSPDVIFQLLPPYAAESVGPALNVGYFFTETSPLPNSWARKASLLDLQIAPCHAQRDWCEASPRWEVPTEVSPVPCDPAEYARGYECPPDLLPPDARHRFLFYTVGELAARKNLRGLLLAYFREFRAWESVGLVVKGTLAGAKPDRAADAVAGLVREVMVEAKLPAAPPVYPVCSRLTRAELLGLHAACDVYVSASRGEGWALPHFDAMAMGKTPVVTAAGGPLDFLDDETGWLVPARPEPCAGEGASHADLFTARRIWAAPDLIAFGRAMRAAYTDAATRTRKAAAGPDRAAGFSYAAVGRRFMEVFDAHVARPAGRRRR